VAAGEADAGLVYATDVVGDDAVESIVPEGAAEVVNRYPIAALADAAHPEAAAAFVAFVLSGAGRAILADFGFGAP
jgi:molybdate transport system substrate-binding protein